MGYEIVETICFFRKSKLVTVLVVWESSKGYVRATYSDTVVRGGYFYLKGNEVMNEELFQEVAAAGMNAPEFLKQRLICYNDVKFER